MTAYRVRRHRSRYRRRSDSKSTVAAVVVALAAAGAVTGNHAATAGGHSAAAAAARQPATTDARLTANSAAAKAISYAEQQIGKPYLWGGTGPDAFDCSGLTQAAYAAAGVSVERTSQEQWASERRVDPSQVQAGDLVFFAGADGTTTAPGHVGLVVDAAGHKMIDAYATGYPIGYDTYGPNASRPGLDNPVGFTQP